MQRAVLLDPLTLRQPLHPQTQSFYIVASIVIFIVIVAKNPTEILLPLISVLLGGSVLVSSGMKSVVMSLVFVLLARPFDAGDLVGEKDGVAPHSAHQQQPRACKWF